MTVTRDAPAPAGLVVVTAVKSLRTAKSRFATLGSSDRDRIPGLVVAMLRDTLTAVLAAPEVSRVYVVSPDPVVQRVASEIGAYAVAENGPSGLNAALEAGAAAARDDAGAAVAVLALQADLPGVTAAEIGAVVEAAAGRRAVVPDRDGVGTVALYVPFGQPLRPKFGPGSAAAHTDDGAVSLPGPWPGLRTDVDTRADLDAVHPLGAFTTAALQCVDPAAKCDRGVNPTANR